VNGLLAVPVSAHAKSVKSPPPAPTLQPWMYTLNCAPAVRLPALVELATSLASGPPLLRTSAYALLPGGAR
jgi:hypothetical protein